MDKYSQKERIIKHLQETYGTEPEYLWKAYPQYSVFRHPVSRKWYAAIMNVSKSKLGFQEEQSVDVVNVKCDPVLVGSLLSKKGFLPAYHMNKTTWISILLDESVPDAEIISLLELSYDCVSPKRKK